MSMEGTAALMETAAPLVDVGIASALIENLTVVSVLGPARIVGVHSKPAGVVGRALVSR